MILVRLVDSLERLDRFHGCVPFLVLGAVDGWAADVFRLDAPMLAVGLDAACEPGPALPVRLSAASAASASLRVPRTMRLT
jgi:hypothetical protein